jgi:hypothetical protein
MNRTEFLDNVSNCETHMGRIGRDFVARVNLGATPEQITVAEQQLGFPLPRGFRRFIAEVNGADLFSLAKKGAGLSTGLYITPLATYSSDPESTCLIFDPLNLGVEALSAGVGNASRREASAPMSTPRPRQYKSAAPA